MYYEFYIDVFFMENMILDYLVLLLAGIVLKQAFKPGRILLASLIGAIGACLLVLSPVKNILLLCGAGTGLLICMVKAGYGIKQKRSLVKSSLVVVGVALLLGGIVQALVSQITLPVTAVGILSAFILTLFLKGYQSFKYKTQNIYDIELAYHGKTLRVRGLRDTGNQLIDPVSKKPVSIIYRDAVRELLDKDMRMYYVPYHSIGKSSGILPAVTLDYMSIQREKDLQRVEHPLIAVSKEPVNKEGRYQMILHSFVVDD